MKKRLCYSNDEQNPMRKPNTGMIDDILMKCKDTVMQSEPFCYLVGWVAGKCEEVKKGKVRDKLIWESK